MGKLDKLGGAVRKVADAAMASADDRFASVDNLIGGSPKTPVPDTPPARIEPATKGQGRAPEPEVEVVRKKLTLMLEESAWKQFRTRCIDEGLTGQDVLERLVKEYLSK